eukprot:7391187-Prymnesium_polylepis.1
MSQHVGGPTARQHHTFCARGADPDMRYVPSDVPIERDRVGACSRCLKRFGASWAAPPSGATEGGAAEAAPEATAEPQESRRGRGSRGEASPQPVRSRRRIVRRVLCALTTSRAAQPAGYIVVLIDAVTPSRLPLHLKAVPSPHASICSCGRYM